MQGTHIRAAGACTEDNSGHVTERSNTRFRPSYQQQNSTQNRVVGNDRQGGVPLPSQQQQQHEHTVTVHSPSYYTHTHTHTRTYTPPLSDTPDLSHRDTAAGESGEGGVVGNGRGDTLVYSDHTDRLLCLDV